MNYNKDKFLSILNKLKESFGSQNKMAEALGISSSYITKIYDENTKNPPAPEYLKKIADNSKGITTYEELMKICGYINDDQKLDKIKSELLIKKHKIMEAVKKLKLDNDEKSFLCYIIDKKEEVSKTYRDMINNNKIILAREYFYEEYKNIYDEVSKTKSKNIKKAIDLYDELDNINLDLNLCEKENLSNKSYNKFDIYQKNLKIPVLGSIPAGIPIELIEDVIDYEDISEEMLKGGKEYFALKVKGTSMWPKYLDGDTIIVLKQDDCESGQDAIVMVNGNDGTFKRVIKKDNGITLEPINQQEYNSVSYSNEDIEKLPIKILGVVKEIRRKI